MQAAFEARERFVANASHELRSPLTVIRTEADVTLADPHADVHELRAMGQTCSARPTRWTQLLDGLMVLARSGHGLPGREPLDLASGRAALPRDVSARRACALRLDLRRRSVHGERRLLERLAANLIENGVRYNAPGGYVAVTTHADASGAVLDVVNSGPVVDPAVASRLTEPFERGGRTGTRGSGLGLSIVRAVAEAHGGRLSLMPRARGWAGRCAWCCRRTPGIKGRVHFGGCMTLVHPLRTNVVHPCRASRTAPLNAAVRR